MNTTKPTSKDHANAFVKSNHAAEGTTNKRTDSNFTSPPPTKPNAKAVRPMQNTTRDASARKPISFRGRSGIVSKKIPTPTLLSNCISQTV